jgi:hypothetical protein
VSRRRPALALALLLAIPASLASCTRPDQASRVTTTASLIPAIEVVPDDPSQPYGITAIDYHFHDAHPTRPLGMTRTVVVTNEGSVVHNVTIPGTNIDKNLKPGQRLVIPDIGKKLGGPGYYPFFCALHVPQGMAGVIVIKGAPPPSQATP